MSISRAIIAESTPDRAALAPMERSRPPEKITKLDPKAAMARTDICLRTFRRFVQDRKPGVVMLKKTMTPTTNSHRPASGVARSRAQPGGERQLPAAGARLDGVRALGLFRAHALCSPRTLQARSWDVAARPSSSRTSRPSRTTRIRSARARTSSVSEEISSTPLPASTSSRIRQMDLRFGADVHAGGRLVEDQDLGAGFDGSRQHHLLLVPSAQRLDRPAPRRRAAGS